MLDRKGAKGGERMQLGPLVAPKRPHFRHESLYSCRRKKSEHCWMTREPEVECPQIRNSSAPCRPQLCHADHAQRQTYCRMGSFTNT